jgi:hypothetical protein
MKAVTRSEAIEARRLAFHRAYLAICGALRTLLSDGKPAAIDPGTGWEMVASTASAHLVTPALAVALRNEPSLPADFSDYLVGIHELAAARNGRIEAEIELVLRELGGMGIVPVLLKGSAMLTTGAYPDPGVRIFGDLDIFISAAQLDQAFTYLSDLGFVPYKDASSAAARREHDLPAMIHPDWPAAIELHRHLIHRSAHALLNIEICGPGLRPLEFRGLPALALSATDQVIHSIAHSEIVNGGYRRRVPSLRNLLDLGMLRRHHGDAIDWDQVESRFRAVGMRDVLVHTLALNEGLLGQEAPARLAGDVPAALTSLRDGILNPRGRLTAELWHHTVRILSRLRDEPIEALKAFGPGRWRRRVRVVRRWFRLTR